MVGIVGLEPTRPLGHQILSLTRLPIPSYPHALRFLVGSRKTYYLIRISGCAPPQQHHWSGFHFWLKPLTNKLPSILAPDNRAVRLSLRTTGKSISGWYITSQFRSEVLVWVQTSKPTHLRKILTKWPILLNPVYTKVILFIFNTI